MPPKKTTAIPNLTARELELAVTIWQCMSSLDMMVDYAKLAELAGFKNQASARACWGPARKKLVGGKPSARDVELAALVWRCFQDGGEPKVDYAKFAEAAKLKNASTARACWGPVKKLLQQCSAPAPAPAATEVVVGGKPGGDDQAEAAAPDLAEVETTPPPPRKAPAPRGGGGGGGAKRKRGQAGSDQEEEEEEEEAEAAAAAAFPAPKRRAALAAVRPGGAGPRPGVGLGDGGVGCFGDAGAGAVPLGLHGYVFARPEEPEDEGPVDGEV